MLHGDELVLIFGSEVEQRKKLFKLEGQNGGTTFPPCILNFSPKHCLLPIHRVFWMHKTYQISIMSKKSVQHTYAFSSGQIAVTQ